MPAPVPALAAPPLVRRGAVTVHEVFATTGRILYATVQDGTPRWLAHEGGVYAARAARRFCVAPQSPVAVRFQGSSTLLGRGGVVELHTPGRRGGASGRGYPGRQPLFDATARHRYWVHEGLLRRDGPLGAEVIGAVLAGQTRFWVGSTFGFGLYHAGALRVAFVFDAERRGLNDGVALPPLPGTIVQARCVFSASRCHLLIATREAGRTVHLLRDPAERRGGGACRGQAGDGSWLGTPWGVCAAGDFLLAPTDDGIVRVEAQGAALVETRRFPDTEPFVDAGSILLPGAGGLYVVGSGRSSSCGSPEGRMVGISRKCSRRNRGTPCGVLAPRHTMLAYARRATCRRSSSSTKASQYSRRINSLPTSGACRGVPVQ